MVSSSHNNGIFKNNGTRTSYFFLKFKIFFYKKNRILTNIVFGVILTNIVGHT